MLECVDEVVGRALEQRLLYEEGLGPGEMRLTDGDLDEAVVTELAGTSMSALPQSGGKSSASGHLLEEVVCAHFALGVRCFSLTVSLRSVIHGYLVVRSFFAAESVWRSSSCRELLRSSQAK